MKRLQKLMKPVSALLVAVMVLIVAAGCSGGGGTATFTPDELKSMLANALVSTSGASAFHHDLSFTVNGQNPGGDSGTSGTFNVGLTSQGTTDVTNNEMQTELKVSFGMKIGDQDTSTQQVSGQVYQVGGYLYLLPELGGNGAWRKTKASQSLTKVYGMNLIEGQFALLTAPVSIDYVKEEKVNGAACNVLAITPDTDLLTQWLRQQGALPSEGIDWSNTEALKNLFQNVTIQVWVDKSAGFIRKLSAVVAAQVDQAMTGDTTGASNMSVDINLDLTLSDFNKSVTITLPPDAQNAPEVSEQDFAFF